VVRPAERIRGLLVAEQAVVRLAASLEGPLDDDILEPVWHDEGNILVLPEASSGSKAD
jgi:hypothetical protein